MPSEYIGHIWERQTWETDNQYGAFLAYRDLGTNRSVDAAFEVYDEKKKAQKSAKKAQKSAKKDQKAQKKKRANGTFRGWVKDNDWARRATEYDAFVQHELDTAKLEAQKEAQVEIVGKIAQAALDATLKMLEKPSLEKVRKKYKVDKDGKQSLIEMITEQQSVFASEGIVRFSLQSLLPQFFGNIADIDPNDIKSKTDAELEALIKGK